MVTIKKRIIEIGDWDMDASANVNITESRIGITLENIRQVSVLIYPDNPIDASFLIRSGYVILDYDNNWLRLFRDNGGNFDSTAYDSTSYNRGLITITYIA